MGIKDLLLNDENFKYERTDINHKNYIDMLHEISSVPLVGDINGNVNYKEEIIIPQINKDDVLIIVDMQNDFMDYENSSDYEKKQWFGTDIDETKAGAFGVAESTNMDLDNFVKVIQKFKDENAMIIATKDYHPPGHCSFKSTSTTDGIYPDHCVWDEPGAKIVEPILNEIKNYPNSRIVYKGFDVNTDSFSGLQYAKYKNEISNVCGCGTVNVGGGCSSTWTGSFEIEGLGKEDNPDTKFMQEHIDKCKENGNFNKKDGCTMTRLDTILEEAKPLNIFIVGLAGDICVLDTAINAALAGYKVYIIDDLIRIAFVPIKLGGKGYVNTPLDFLDKINGKDITLIKSSKITGGAAGTAGGFGKRRKSRKSRKSRKKSKRKSRKKSKRKSLKKSKRKSRKSRKKSKRK
jgi:nicotinamidase-related amidase